MVKFSRENIIQYGKEQGYRPSDINNALLKAGIEETYNPLLDWENIKTIPSNLKRNVVDFKRDLITAGGMVLSPVIETSKKIKSAEEGRKLDEVKKAFAGAINNNALKRTALGAGAGAVAGSLIPAVGTTGGAILGGLTGLIGPKDMANSMLSTYNTTLDDVRSGNVDWRNIAQGAIENPLYAGLDVLSLGGAKVGGKIVDKIGNSIKPSSNQAVRAVLPSKDMRNFSRAITESLVQSRANSSPMFKAYNTLASMPTANRTEIVRNIITNEGKLTKRDRNIANAIKRDLNLNEQEAIRRGFLKPDFAKNNTISQYVVNKLDPSLNIIHDDIMQVLYGNKYPIRAIEPEVINDINKYITEGSKLYDENKISFLTQALSNTTDPLGQVIASDIAKEGKGYYGTKRIIGRATPENLGKVLDDSIKYQLDQLTRASEASDLLDDVIFNNPMMKEFKKGVDTTGKTIVNKKAFNDAIREAVENGGQIDITRAFNKARKAEEGSIMVDNMYLDAIKNALKPTNNTAIDKISNAFKKAVLANPHWVILNRIGNITNNSMGGVSLADYVDAMKYKKLIPKKLLQQTSFNSYISAGVEGASSPSLLQTFTKPINDVFREINKYDASNKSLGEAGKLVSGLYASLSDITSNPVFRLESSLERVDRFANFIKQAKSINKKNWKNIVKKADSDDNLFNQLNTRVNKDLGDYVGRNYFMPKEAYNTLSTLIPFYRFLSQTGRTTAHQLANHRLAFQANVGIPARVGNVASENILQQYKGLNREDYEGGVPYNKKGNELRTIGFEPLPVGAVLGNIADIASGENIESLINPIFTMIPDITRFQKMGGKLSATSPRRTMMQLTSPSEAKNYKPTVSELAKYGVNKFLGTTFNPWRWSTQYIPDIYTTITGGSSGSKFDTLERLNIVDKNGNVLYSGFDNPLSYKRTLPEELSGRIIGIQTRSNYLKRGKSSPSREARARSYNTKKMKQFLKEGK